MRVVSRRYVSSRGLLVYVRMPCPQVAACESVYPTLVQVHTCCVVRGVYRACIHVHRSPEGEHPMSEAAEAQLKRG